MPTRVTFCNPQLVMCPACLEPLLHFAWSRALAGTEADVHELAARCDQCERWWIVGYSREDHKEKTHD